MSTKELTQDDIKKFKALPEGTKQDVRATFAAIDEEAAASRRAAHERAKVAADRDARAAARHLRTFYDADTTRTLLTNIQNEICV